MNEAWRVEAAVEFRPGLRERNPHKNVALRGLLSLGKGFDLSLK